MITTKNWKEFADKNYDDIIKFVYKILSKNGYRGHSSSDTVREYADNALIDIHRKDILNKYNERKGAFTTYIYNAVRFSIMNDRENVKKRRDRKIRKKFEEEYIKLTNTDTQQQQNNIRDEIKHQENVVFVKMFKEYVKKNFNKYTTIINLVMNDKTASDYSHVFKKQARKFYEEKWNLRCIAEIYKSGFTGPFKEFVAKKA